MATLVYRFNGATEEERKAYITGYRCALHDAMEVAEGYYERVD